MRGIIDNILAFYEMQEEALSVLMANTRKAMQAPGPTFEQRFDEEIRQLKAAINKGAKTVNKTLAETTGNSQTILRDSDLEHQIRRCT